MFKRLWQDSYGSVVSPEIVVVGAILLLGVIAGLSALRMAILTETKDVGEAVHAVDFTPKITPIERAPPDSKKTGRVATDFFQEQVGKLEGEQP